MTRGRHHNLACVITEPASDEHQHNQPIAAADVLAAAMRKTSNHKSATETLRDELHHPDGPASGRDALVDGLRQTQAHTDIVGQTISQEAKRQALTHHEDTPAAQAATRRGAEL
jgi:hypothetical protein